MDWEDGTDELRIEFYCIQKGGSFEHAGKQVGQSLFHHYREAIKFLWPDEYMHRWTDLILSEILNNTITPINPPARTERHRQDAHRF